MKLDRYDISDIRSGDQPEERVCEDGAWCDSDDVAKLESERNGLETLLLAMITKGVAPSVTYCAYCYGEIGEAPNEAQVIEHTKQCDKHPTHKIISERNRLQADKVELMGMLKYAINHAHDNNGDKVQGRIEPTYLKHKKQMEPKA